MCSLPERDKTMEKKFYISNSARQSYFTSGRSYEAQMRNNRLSCWRNVSPVWFIFVLSLRIRGERWHRVFLSLFRESRVTSRVSSWFYWRSYRVTYRVLPIVNIEDLSMCTFDNNHLNISRVINNYFVLLRKFVNHSNLKLNFIYKFFLVGYNFWANKKCFKYFLISLLSRENFRFLNWTILHTDSV